MLKEQDVGRFPFPLEGRIPNFQGAKKAAEKCGKLDVVQEAEYIKVNPDSPQRAFRRAVLEAGKTLFVPTPRLRDGFYRLHRRDIPIDDLSKAVTLKGMKQYGVTIDPEALTSIELIVTGSVAVSEEGGRIGKGEGYSDLEYAIMRELGGGDVPVLTTVHEYQIVEPFPVKKHDIALDYIVTPDRSIGTDTSFCKPDGIDWTLLSEEDMEAMPVLKQQR